MVDLGHHSEARVPGTHALLQYAAFHSARKRVQVGGGGYRQPPQRRSAAAKVTKQESFLL